MSKCLVFEANDELRECLRCILRRRFLSLEIMEAAESREALRATNSGTPDVVVMDIPTPNRDGPELIGLLRHRCPAARIVILTQHHYLEYEQFAYRCGADYVVSKLSPMADILGVIERAVETSATKGDFDS